MDLSKSFSIVHICKKTRWPGLVVIVKPYLEFRYFVHSDVISDGANNNSGLAITASLAHVLC